MSSARSSQAQSCCGPPASAFLGRDILLHTLVPWGRLPQWTLRTWQARPRFPLLPGLILACCICCCHRHWLYPPSPVFGGRVGAGTATFLLKAADHWILRLAVGDEHGPVRRLSSCKPLSVRTSERWPVHSLQSTAYWEPQRWLLKSALQEHVRNCSGPSAAPHL